jgi:hypothetical protein
MASARMREVTQVLPACLSAATNSYDSCGGACGSCSPSIMSSGVWMRVTSGSTATGFSNCVHVLQERRDPPRRTIRAPLRRRSAVSRRHLPPQFLRRRTDERIRNGRRNSDSSSVAGATELSTKTGTYGRRSNGKVMFHFLQAVAFGFGEYEQDDKELEDCHRGEENEWFSSGASRHDRENG